MKKMIVVLIALGLVSSVGMAAEKKGAAAAPASGGGYTASPGEPDTDSCGLGWQVTQKKTMIATTTRGTTNAFIPPTFGMTSGTMGCMKHEFSKKDEAAAVYAATNQDTLTIEMAEGSGEYLSGFARTLGCNDAANGAFGRMTQQNYKAITSGKTAVELFNNVKDQIRRNPALAAACNS